MCGIAGLWTSGPVDERVVEAMTRVLHHRGPDDHGLWLDQEAGIGLGNRRLAIVDLSPAGHQPMLSDSGRYVLTYNGEIYNHADLRGELEQAGESAWRGHSDTEVLLKAIEKWGIGEAIGKSVGMFALALWDRKQRVLILARDRIGEKPLYFGWSQGSFLFGSELKSLTAHPSFAPTVDRTALDRFIRRSYIPAPLSIYSDVYKLEPGTILTLSASAAREKPSTFTGLPTTLPGLTLERYWSYRDVLSQALAAPITSEADALAGLEKCLIRAVQEQSIADVPVGTFLSGGYDSSTIAAVQQRHSNSQVSTFTIGFDELGFDEAPHARAVAQHLGTQHHEMRLGPQDALAVIPDLPRIYDEPFADSSQIPTYLLSKFARGSVTVALSGDGGDELFGGYNRFVFFEQHRRRLARLPLALRKAATGLIRGAGTERIDAFGAATGFSRLYPQLGLKAQKVASLLAGGDQLPALYGVLLSQWDFTSSVVREIEHDPSWPKEELLEGVGDALQMMLWDGTGYLPDDILVKVDRASMAASLETHAPFLDHRLVEFVARVPLDMKIRGGRGKWLLRQLLYKYVPRELVDRPKAGFSVPLGQWLRGPLRDWAEGLLDRRRLEAEGFLRTDVITDRWATHLSGQRDYSTPLWSILMFQAWLEENSGVLPRSTSSA